MVVSVALRLLMSVSLPLVLGDRGLPAATLKRVKEATVFVKVESGRFIVGSGSGFLIRKRGRTGYVATNEHVIRTRRPNEPVKISVVFHSGTPDEVTVDAHVVVKDADADIAILRVEKKRLPRPLKLESRAKVRETLPVFIIGYPFGRSLAASGRYPAPTVGTGTISSMRTDDSGRVHRIQIDGDLNPGNSGGPIVDRRGALVGIAVATIQGTQISMAIPPHVLGGLLEGRVHLLSFRETANKKGRVQLRADAELADPGKFIKSVAVLLAPAGSAVDVRRKKSGSYESLANAEEHKLLIKAEHAAGNITLNGAVGEKREYLIQVKTITRSRTMRYSQPRTLRIEFEEQEPKVPAPPGGHDESEPGGDTPVNDVVVAPKEKETRMPAPIEDLAIADAGRFLAIKLKGVSGLAVYDTNTGELSKILKTASSNYLFGAGGRSAIVYYADANVFESWDLTKQTRLISKPNPFSERVTRIVMGHSRDDRALVVVNNRLHLLRTATLRPIAVGGEPFTLKNYWFSSKDALFRADGFLDHFIVSSSGNANLYTQVGQDYVHKSGRANGSFQLGDEGRIYSTMGKIYNQDLVEVASFPNQILFPAVGGGLFLSVDTDGLVMIHEAGNMAPIGPWGKVPHWSKGKRRSSSEWAWPLWRSIPVDRRTVFLPKRDRIVFVSPDNETMILRPFHLKETLDRSGVAYLFVTSVPDRNIFPGTQWEYRMEVMSKAGGVLYRLEMAPDWIDVSPDGVLSGDVPEDATGTEKVIIRVSDSSGEQTYHIFTLLRAAGSRSTSKPDGHRVHAFDFTG